MKNSASYHCCCWGLGDQSLGKSSGLESSAEISFPSGQGKGFVHMSHWSRGFNITITRDPELFVVYMSKTVKSDESNGLHGSIDIKTIRAV